MLPHHPRWRSTGCAAVYADEPGTLAGAHMFATEFPVEPPLRPTRIYLGNPFPSGIDYSAGNSQPLHPHSVGGSGSGTIISVSPPRRLVEDLADSRCQGCDCLGQSFVITFCFMPHDSGLPALVEFPLSSLDFASSSGNITCMHAIAPVGAFTIRSAISNCGC